MAIQKSMAPGAVPDEARRRLDQAHLGERYRLRGRFRRRSGAPVLLAVDEVDGQLVAIKTVADAEAAQAEARILEALDHPAIVRLRDRLEVDHEVWLVLDYVAGDSVETRLQIAGPMAPEAVAGLLRDLAGALGHVHARGFLHRDLKPANVLVRPEQGPVIIDFGAASHLDGPAQADGAAVLTHGYAAPEQYLADEPEGTWTDIYALGAFGYRALTGEAPPPALDRLDRGVALDLPALDQWPGLEAALARALALDPAARPRTAADFLGLLEADPEPPPVVDEDDDEGLPTVRIARRPGRRPTTTDQASAVVAPTRRRRIVPLLVLLALVLAGVAGAWAARPLYERHIKTTWLVDPAGEGDALTIGDALERAGEGARVVVRPGTYEESLVLTRAAHLVAEAGAEQPVIAPPSGPCLLTTASGASLEGFALEGSDTAGVACLAISGGDFKVSDSRITASAGPAIEVRAGAAPEIRASEIRGTGVVVREGAQPALSELTIDGVEGPSLVVRSGALPEVTGNRIQGSGPVVFAEGGAGVLEGNEIVDARSNAIEVASGATPMVKDNQIARAGEAGVFVYGEGRGRFEDNTIEGSRLSAIVIGAGARATLVGNQLKGSGEHGILVLDGAHAVIDDNTMEGSRGQGVAIAPEAAVELGQNGFAANRSGAVLDARPKTARGTGPGDNDGGA